MKTRRLTPDEVEAAAEILKSGGLLAFPTETVYGLGANGLDGAAVRRIFEAKGRPQDNPLILHLPSAEWLDRCCADIPPLAYRLAEAFWPGPLTVVLKRRACVPDEVTAGLGTVAVRVPAQETARAIIERAGVPVAAPSANTSGKPSPTTAAHVLEDLDGRIDGIVDGGDCAVGVESAILDLTVSPPRLLRPGGLAPEAIVQIVGEIDMAQSEVDSAEVPRAPGMKYRHYAPRAPLTAVLGEGEKTARYIAAHAARNAGVLCFDDFAALFGGRIVESMGAAGDDRAQARRVFAALRRLDATGAGELWAQCPAPQGLGLAISNRLCKAAGGRIVDLRGEFE